MERLITCLGLIWVISQGCKADATSFSCAISTLTLHASQAPYSVCTIQTQPGSIGAYISLQWMTGTFSKGNIGVESVLVSLYIDGETNASLSYYPYTLAGFPSYEAFASAGTPPLSKNTWQAALFSRGSASSWTNNMQIPFQKSLQITLQLMTPNGTATVYYQAHGLDGISPTFAGVTLPPTARMVMQTWSGILPALSYLPVVNFAAGTKGMIVGIAIAFVAPNLNTLEGCFHLYKTASTPYPGELHSTGTEDEFLSSYYFDLGVYQGKSSGIFYKNWGGTPTTNASISMYRTYQDDPMIFNDGGKFVWRNGDTADAVTGIKCMIETGGVVAGSPGPAETQTLSWSYVWPAQ